MTKSFVCFSGHRTYARTPDDEARLAGALDEAWADGCRVFISGMAPGFDLAAAEAVVRLRALHDDVRLVAAIPFTGQDRGYTPDDRQRYETLIAAADELHVLGEGYTHGCYYRRDEWMVERASRVICWYDASKRGSGTRYTVRYALRCALEVVNLFRSPASLF
jgi:uncharacterized phage-like protein YoqJ